MVRWMSFRVRLIFCSVSIRVHLWLNLNEIHPLLKIQRPRRFRDQSWRSDGRVAGFAAFLRLRRRLLLDASANAAGHVARCLAAGVVAGTDRSRAAKRIPNSTDAR